MKIKYNTYIFNYRYILYLALASIGFLSCQKNDPLIFFPSEAKSLGYNKVSELNDNFKYQFGINAIVQKPDSIMNISVIIPEISEFKEYEVYFTTFNDFDYSIHIHCSGLGKRLKDKMIREKEVKNFGFKEIFNEKNAFISPIDEDNVLVSSSMDDIRKAIKRKEAKSILSNSAIVEMMDIIPEDSKSWLISKNGKEIIALVAPLITDSLSTIGKYPGSYKSCLFFKNGRSNLYLDGEVGSNDDTNLIETIKGSLQKLDYRQIKNNTANYDFTNFEITNSNNNFRIILK